MYLPDTILPATALDNVALGDTIASLDAVRAAHVALAMWRRPVPLHAALPDLDTVDDLSITLDHRDAQATLAASLLDAGYPPEITAELAADVALLAATHRDLTGAATTKIRLDVIDTDACRRFHADYVTLRMLCTYRGAGTQWCRAAAPDAIHDLATGTVGVFKGRLAMEEPTILHRSPPLRTTGGQRLLLVIDPA